MFDPRRLSFPLLAVFSACVSTTGVVPRDWRTVPQAAEVRGLAFAADGTVAPAAPSDPRRDDGPVVVARDAVGPTLANGLRLLAGPFLEIDSHAFSDSRGEVVFSAKRDDNFDIGLVSSEGSAVNWLPVDPADEVAVQWAPRGNKVSYLIRANGGDVVRTLHIPTSFQYAVPFENATIHALEWEPAAEKYAVAYSTPDASDRVEVLEYDGSHRRVVIPPAEKLAVDVMPVGSGSVALRPLDVAYGERLPLVVWVADDFSWSDARAALMRDARVAVVVTKRDPHPGSDLWTALAAEPWIDSSHPFVVSPHLVTLAQGVVITGDSALDPGQYRRSGNVVAAAPAVVQSFAARFIADQLKRTTPPNVSSR
jgi:hypothetical protein